MKKRPKKVYQSIRGRQKGRDFSEPFDRLKRLIDRILLNKIVLAVAAGLIVGSLFGLTSLHVLTNNSDAHVFQEETETAQETHTPSSEPMTEIVFDISDLYVIQVGLFHERENADLRKRQLERGNIPTFIWEREGEFFLLHSIHTSESSAKKINEELQEKSLEAFVKKWDMPQLDKKVTPDELTFIEKYILMWEESVKQLEAGSSIQLAKWEALQQEETDSPLISTIQIKLADSLPNLQDENLRHLAPLQLLFLLEKILTEKIVQN